VGKRQKCCPEVWNFDSAENETQENAMSQKLEIDTHCQEASPLSRNFKIDCGTPAVGIVWHNKDQKAYPMCDSCLDHNVTNRGGILLVQAPSEAKKKL
jgi:hypothetical protein